MLNSPNKNAEEYHGIKKFRFFYECEQKGLTGQLFGQKEPFDNRKDVASLLLNSRKPQCADDFKQKLVLKKQELEEEDVIPYVLTKGQLIPDMVLFFEFYYLLGLVFGYVNYLQREHELKN